MDELNGLQGPAWPGVTVRFTTRQGGVSVAPFDSLNLGAHVGDEPAAVAENRRRVVAGLPATPRWLDQVHGTTVLDADRMPTTESQPPQADAAFTTEPLRVVAVMVADCLPIALTDGQGTIVAVVHAGWRGLAGGVIEQTMRRLKQARPDEPHWRAWIGPAIGPSAFEVGAEVVQAFVQADPDAASCFTARAGGQSSGMAAAPGASHEKWLADLPALAERRLHRIGVNEVVKSGRCTASEPDQFFSYRRDGSCGRMALLAWLEEPAD